MVPADGDAMALRFAWRPTCAEDVFETLEELLESAKCANGWQLEYGNWKSNGSHWATEWDRFYHFFWLLQSFDHFKAQGHDVAFYDDNGGPDLRVAPEKGKAVFVECTVHSKWHFNEVFLEDILGLIDPNLLIRRKHNVRRNDDTNPFAEKNFARTLEEVVSRLNDGTLDSAKIEAERVQPQVIARFADADIEIVLSGGGDYQPYLNNAHGVPSASRCVYLKEIIERKEDSNKLSEHRPNLLLVNGLGDDYQTALQYENLEPDDFDNEKIDEIWLAACGIDQKLEPCALRQKLRRPRLCRSNALKRN